MSRSFSPWALAVLATIWILIPDTARAQRARFSLSAPVTVAAGDDAGLQAVAIGDLNGDLRPDIVAVSADAEDGPLAILINNGDGTYAAPRFVADEELSLSTPVAVSIADVGAVSGGPDGNNDIIVADIDDGFLVVFGDGQGNFTIEGDVTVVDGLDIPVGLAVGDFDGQNGPDFAIIDEEGPEDNGQVHFFCNQGIAGLFSPCPTGVLDSGGEMPIDVGVGDFDGDGILDVLVLNQGSGAADTGTLALFVGSGDGSFSIPAQPTFPIPRIGQDLAIGDINPDEDSIDDAVVVDNDTFGLDNVSVYFGSTTGAILQRRTAVLELGTTAVGIGTFAGSINPDLVGANDFEGSNLSVLLGNGTREQPPFSETGALVAATISGTVTAMAVGRLNQDELDDLAYVRLDEDDETQLFIALNTSTSATETPGSPMPGSPTPTPTPSRAATPELKGCTVQISSTPIEPVALASGDFDRDGNPDVAAVDGIGDRVVVLLTDRGQLRGPNSPCTITRSAPYDVDAGPVSIVAADLNRDARLDLVVATGNGVSVLLASMGAPGEFEMARTVATGFAARSVAVDDFDHDGKQDLAVARADGVSVRFGSGDGFTFEERTTRPAFSIAGAFIVVAADLNGDLWADLAVASDTDNTLRILLQNPGSPGTFPNQPAQGNVLTLSGGRPTAMIAAAVSAGAAPQLIVAMRGVVTGAGTFAIVRRSGNAFSLGPTIATGGRPSALSTGEFIPSSGLTDVLVASSASSNVGFFPGNSDGSFGGLSSTSTAGQMPSALISADFDGDGKTDVAVANQVDGTLTLLLSTNVDPTPTPTAIPIVSPSSTPTITGTPGPSSTQTRGTPEPTATFKEGTFELSSCSIVDVRSAAGGHSGVVLAGAVVMLWLRSRRTREKRSRR